jgi:hypothetical protein
VNCRRGDNQEGKSQQGPLVDHNADPQTVPNYGRARGASLDGRDGFAKAAIGAYNKRPFHLDSVTPQCRPTCLKEVLVGIGLNSCLTRNWVRCGFTGCGSLLIFLFVLASFSIATPQTNPFSVSDVEKLAMQGTEEHAFLELVKQHGISFAPTLDVLEELKASHVPASVLKEIGAHTPQGQAPDFYLREGDRLLAKGYYSEAVAYYQRILAQLPDDPTAKARLEQAADQQQKAEQESQFHSARDDERRNLSYYRQQLTASLQKPDCKESFYYAHKIFFVEPGQSEKTAFEKACGPYSLALEEGTPVTLEFQRDLSGSSAHAGDKIDFKVADPIVVKGLLVVPKDGLAWGTIEKSKGGRNLARSGQLKISIEGMSLADGEKCSLADEETYRGAKKGKIKVLTGTVLTGGIALPFLHGHDSKIAAGTKVTARVVGKMDLDPMRFVPPGPAPNLSAVGGLSVISFQNQSGVDATVRLLGPSAQQFTVLNAQSFDANVAPGNYYVLVRYGRIPMEYLFSKAGPVSVTEVNGQHSKVRINLLRPGTNNQDAQKEFDKGQ